MSNTIAHPSSNAPVITIDGPVGAGKGTIALHVAHRFGWHTLDSGALYRIVALVAQQQNIALNDAASLSEVAETLDITFIPRQDLSSIDIFLAEQNITQAIRTEQCGTAASQVAALSIVRAALLSRQKAFRQPPGLVADGRDMGTVVFLDADLKIFLTASAEQRAERRYKQLKAKGINASLASLITDIKNRDERDQNRTVAPLVAATDAITIDSTERSIEEVVGVVIEAALEKGVIAQSI